MTDFRRRQNFGMREVNALSVARGRIRVKHERIAFREHHGAACERADAQLRALQVDQDADRPAIFELDGTDERYKLAHALMRSVAHIDAKDIRTRTKQIRDDDTVGR